MFAPGTGQPAVIPFASKGFGSYWPKLCFCMATSCPCAHRKFAGALAVFVAAEGELVQTEGGTRSSRDETKALRAAVRWYHAEHGPLSAIPTQRVPRPRVRHPAYARFAGQAQPQAPATGQDPRPAPAHFAALEAPGRRDRCPHVIHVEGRSPTTLWRTRLDRPARTPRTSCATRRRPSRCRPVPMSTRRLDISA